MVEQLSGELNREQADLVDAPRSSLAERDTAVARVHALGTEREDWANWAWQQLCRWAEEDGLTARPATHGGCRYLVIEVAASQPAFSPGQRQGLLLSARLEPERARQAVGATLAGVCIARGGWSALLGLEAARALRDSERPTARDFTLCIEIDEGVLPRSQPLAEAPVLDGLSRAAFALSEWGGWSMQTEKFRAIPVAIAQKGRLLVALRSRGEGGDPSLRSQGRAVDLLRGALDAVDSLPRPWRKTESSKAFVTAMAEASGLGKALMWRALLGGGPWHRALSRFPRANHALIEALFHDTVTLVSLRADAVAGGVATEAEALLDCRLLPGVDQTRWLAELRRRAGPHIEVEVVRSRLAMSAPLHTPLLRCVMETVQRRDSEATVVPMLMPGTCDSLGWRQSAIPCYGFSPLQLSEDQDALKQWGTGALSPSDEQLRWGIGAMCEVVSRFCVDA